MKDSGAAWERYLKERRLNRIRVLRPVKKGGRYKRWLLKHRGKDFKKVPVALDKGEGAGV